MDSIHPQTRPFMTPPESGQWQWLPENRAYTEHATLDRDVSPELDEVDSFPTPRPPPRNLPLRISSLGPSLAKLDALYGPDYHMNTRDEYDIHDMKTIEGATAFHEHNAQRMAYVQLSSQRLQAAMGICNVNAFDLPLDTAKRVITPPGLLDGYKPISITPLTAHNIAPVIAPSNGVSQGAADCGARVLRKKDSGVSLSGQTKPFPIGMDNIDKETGKGLREFMLAKGKEHGMRKREAKEISFWDFTTDLKTSVAKKERALLYDVTEPGDRIDVYEIDL